MRGRGLCALAHAVGSDFGKRRTFPYARPRTYGPHRRAYAVLDALHTDRMNGITSVLTGSLNAWIDRRAGSKGAALAFYALFSMTPILMLAIAAAGYFFGAETARGAIVDQVQPLVGSGGALVILALLAGAGDPLAGVTATMVASVLLLVA